MAAISIVHEHMCSILITCNNQQQQNVDDLPTLHSCVPLIGSKLCNSDVIMHTARMHWTQTLHSHSLK